MTTRSPGSASAGEIDVPPELCREDECGSETPNCAYTNCVKPEQSKPAGSEPPYRYGTPWYCSATATTWSRLKLGYGGLARKSATRGPLYDAYCTRSCARRSSAADVAV